MRGGRFCGTGFPARGRCTHRLRPKDETTIASAKRLQERSLARLLNQRITADIHGVT
jgi:hypothetical protein